MHKPGHRQKYSNRPSVSNIVEKRRLEEKNKVDYIKNLMFRGNKASMQEFINKASVEYKPWYAEDKLGNYFLNKANLDKKPINIYERENLWKQWEEQGSPKVRQWSKKEFKKADKIFTDPEKKAWWHGEPRAFYEPKSNRITIQAGDVDDFFAELAHSAQWKAKDKSKRISLWDTFKSPYQRMIYGEKVYDMPSHLEYGAHEEIQPQSIESFIKSTPASYRE